MFPWNIAKSAEAMLSRWAIKRLFKFLLKKKLGQFILGDIDLDQLEVQLSAGTIQLSDLALNVDYLNQQFSAVAAVTVKEGSIGSLLVKMPWKGNGCQIEIDELELLLAPSVDKNSRAGEESCINSQDGNQSTNHEVGKLDCEMLENAMTSGSVDVHEGVKTIAKMVKWLLTSFNIKVRKLIVAFDPCSEKDEKKTGQYSTLVLRISEAECGTCISEDAASNSDARAESFLGLNRLMNFVKFQGVILELLHMDDVDRFFSASGTTFDECFACCSLSNATTPIMTGEKGGFSGTLRLSIPWKNGSLDIHKVDANVSIDPVKLRIQPSSIKWFLILLESIRSIDKDGRGHMHQKSMDSVYFNMASHFSSSTGSPDLATDKSTPICESFSTEICSPIEQELVTDGLLQGSHLISDWVPFSINKNQKYGTEEDLDFGESMDQFFECFDGMRSSQSALGSSGMWNWTCSIFSAITAASSLASGSLHVPNEQQHVETNFKALATGISIVFSFYDEDQKHSCDLKGDHADPDFHYLVAECRDTSLVLQVCPRDMKVEATVQHIELADYYCNGNNDRKFGLHSQTHFMQHLQDEVEAALPRFALSSSIHDVQRPCRVAATIFPFINSTSINEDNVVKVTLLQTSGASHCQLTVNSSSVDGTLTGPTSFSLKLPPFVFWVNFHLINILYDFVKEVGNCVEKSIAGNVIPSDALKENHKFPKGDVKRGSHPCVTTLSSKESLRGNIFLLDARVILCFPIKNGEDCGGYSIWDQFISLDFSSPSTLSKGIIEDANRISHASSQKRYSSATTRAFHLNVGNLDVHLVTSSCKDDVGISSCNMQRQKFSAQHISSVTSGKNCPSVISMIWQEGTTTGPWIAKKAKSLANLEDSRRRNKFMGTGYEFASVTAVKDLEDLYSRTRQEIILSSALFLHVHLSPVSVNLDSSQYKGVHHLLDQVIKEFSCLTCDPVAIGEQSPVSQTTFLVECDSVEISISPETIGSTNESMQTELPSSWHYLKLKIQKFNVLSVSDIGGIRGANFLWVSHREGKLWGSTTGVPDEMFLLISCCNSTMKRGDGEGSNALSSRFAGSDIIYLWEPENSHSSTSTSVRCGTIVAVGGRLDWLDAIFSFFSLPTSETEETVENSLHKGNSSVSSGASFVLDLVDIGLSYEPHLKNLVVRGEVFDFESSSGNANEETSESVACLLAASSLSLSNTTVAGSVDNEYTIRVQDLGLLICAVSGPENVGGTYSVQHLHKVGYVKVAGEALLEAILRTNCKNGLLWEVECSESHIDVDTCHDTTSGLIHLAAQLQQLFAPDIEESVVHLQTRWNNVQQAQEKNYSSDERMIYNDESAPSASQLHTCSPDRSNKLGMVGLMDEICEDTFQLDGNRTFEYDSCESPLHNSMDGGFLGEAHNLTRLQSSQTLIPGYIEGYCLSELRHLSELSVSSQSSNEIRKCTSRNMGNGDLGKGTSGWYGDSALRIVENHIAEVSEGIGVKQFAEGRLPFMHRTRSDGSEKAKGRLLLKNINVRWRMYAGSDWLDSRKSGHHIRGRNTAGCLELALSRMDFQYDLFHDGEALVSKLSLSVQDFHFYDNSRGAPWKLVLGYYDSKKHPRESFSKAFKLDLEAVRPDPSTPLEEYRLHIALLPMLLHLHQSQLDFLISFFGESTSGDQSPSHPQDLGRSKSSPAEYSNLGRHTIAVEALLPYFQKFDIWPVLVRVDYSPCRVDLTALRGGKYVELVNLVPWKGVELQLKHVNGAGVFGWSSVCETIIGEWLEDISQNQVHKLLKGLPPIRSLVAVGSGAAKLVSLPIKNYKKDQRLLKGMQRGTIAFLRSISLEAVGLGVHLAAGAHDILLQAEYILTSIPPSVPWPVQNRTGSNIRSNQPKDAKQGIQQAYESLSDGLGKSASALIRTPLKKYQRGSGAGSALATAVRGAPAAAIAPASAAFGAVRCALLGVRNSLDPEHKKESMEKYHGPTQPQERT